MATLQSFFYEFFKFGLVGVLNTGVSLAVFNGLLFFSSVRQGWAIGLITFIAYIAGVTNSFFWNKWWVFRYGESGRARVEYVRFFIFATTNALLGAGIVYSLTTYLPHPAVAPALWANIAILITFPISMLANFFAYKRFVFVQKAP
jgi:putative flippase GtrA